MPSATEGRGSGSGLMKTEGGQLTGGNASACRGLLRRQTEWHRLAYAVCAQSIDVPPSGASYAGRVQRESKPAIEAIPRAVWAAMRTAGTASSRNGKIACTTCRPADCLFTANPSRPLRRAIHPGCWMISLRAGWKMHLRVSFGALAGEEDQPLDHLGAHCPVLFFHQRLRQPLRPVRLSSPRCPRSCLLGHRAPSFHGTTTGAGGNMCGSRLGHVQARR